MQITFGLHRRRVLSIPLHDGKNGNWEPLSVSSDPAKAKGEVIPRESEDAAPAVLALGLAESEDPFSHFHNVDHALEFPPGLEAQPTIRGNPSCLFPVSPLSG